MEYLRSVQPESGNSVQVVANAQNLGFPAGANQGMRLARGKQILLLNNDTVVPPGWNARADASGNLILTREDAR